LRIVYELGENFCRPMVETLITIPAGLGTFFAGSEARQKRFLSRFNPGGGKVYVSSDPRGMKLGSGGGTVCALWAAWKSSFGPSTLEEWLAASQRVILHAGGESRRLPSYAALGKAFIPLKDSGDAVRFDHVLADVQVPQLQGVLLESGWSSRVLVASGDVLLDFPPRPIGSAEKDIVGVGLAVPKDFATHFGVFFVPMDEGSCSNAPIEHFRQKPSIEEINQLSASHRALVDTGIWLLSLRAVKCLLRRCGWNSRIQAFDTPNGWPLPLDLYGEVGAALGKDRFISPALSRAGFSQLTSAVCTLEEGRFLHLGSSRQLLESAKELRNLRRDRKSGPKFPSAKREVWIEGCAPRRLPDCAGANVITGLPNGSKIKALRAEQCVDVLPVGKNQYVLRIYHLDDQLRGEAGNGTICGRNAGLWLKDRGMMEMEGDVVSFRIYPLLRAGEIDQRILDWFFADFPSEAITERWKKMIRFSAAEIPERSNFSRYFDQRLICQENSLREAFKLLIVRRDRQIYRKDFDGIAQFCRDQASGLGVWINRHHRALLASTVDPIESARLHFFLARLSRSARKRRELRGHAFDRLKSAVMNRARRPVGIPKLGLTGEQMVLAKSPARIDLAGGWSDTPPYCLEKGGHVINAAISMNGMPTVEVYIKAIDRPEFRLRSLDQGLSETVTSYARLNQCRDPKGVFSLHKAALVLAGFARSDPGSNSFSRLTQQLRAFGGGLEIVSWSRAPKGSGLGTSSILAATLVAALAKACKRKMGTREIYGEVLEIEQLLTTGGGWQDQAGALFPGLKSLRTDPGMEQTVTVESFPSSSILPFEAGGDFLLYYTGITRLAKVILGDIVEGMTLGRSSTLAVTNSIRGNADAMAEALRAGNSGLIKRCIARSWRLNKELDSGTSTPEIDKIVALCGDDLAGCKLLGAGGGGFLLIAANDPKAAKRIRARLEKNPPNASAGFVSFAISDSAIETSIVSTNEVGAFKVNDPPANFRGATVVNHSARKRGFR
jgi:fucokinase / fucose-1-phosphate guanylyltransferase